jgi:hypothetical protein
MVSTYQRGFAWLSHALVSARTSMNDHNAQTLSPREMVRAHAYPVLAAISTLSLVALALLQVPGAIKAHRYNQCVDGQVRLRQVGQLTGQDGPGKLVYLKAVQHCEWR